LGASAASQRFAASAGVVSYDTPSQTIAATIGDTYEISFNLNGGPVRVASIATSTRTDQTIPTASMCLLNPSWNYSDFDYGTV
jgi:hypothetical protein